MSVCRATVVPVRERRGVSIGHKILTSSHQRYIMSIRATCRVSTHIVAMVPIHCWYGMSVRRRSRTSIRIRCSVPVRQASMPSHHERRSMPTGQVRG